MTIIVPPLAQLPRTLQSLDEICRVLDRALGPLQRFRRVRGDRENDLRLAVGVHALNALDGARAVSILARNEQGASLTPHFRMVFEALVKIRWMRKDASRARDYLDSEPFERYVLATERVKKSPRWPVVVDDCKKAVAANPRLLNPPNARKGISRKADFRAIAAGLRMPDLDDMGRAIGMDEDDYLIDFDVPSLYPHTSVTHTKNFAKAVNIDGTVLLSTAIDPYMLLGYVARTATRSREIIKEVLDLFPDGAVLYDAEKAAETLAELTTVLRSVIPK